MVAQHILEDMTADPTLQAKIKQAKSEGWKIAKKKEHMAVMKKRSIGALKWHLFFLIFTMGIGNIPYALYRLIRPKKMVVKGAPQEELKKEALKAQREKQKEQAKNARETMRTIRKFF
jgi:cell division septal protein FtsQ